MSSSKIAAPEFTEQQVVDHGRANVEKNLGTVEAIQTATVILTQAINQAKSGDTLSILFTVRIAPDNSVTITNSSPEIDTPLPEVLIPLIKISCAYNINNFPIILSQLGFSAVDFPTGLSPKAFWTAAIKKLLEKGLLINFVDKALKDNNIARFHEELAKIRKTLTT